MAVSPESVLTKVGSNLTFLKDWSKSNEEKFVQCMDILADERPDRFAELFLKVQDKIAPPKETKTDINIHVNKDIDKLQALASTFDRSPRLESPSQKTEFTPYEEIQE